jgi:hypothetical protein
VFSLLITYQNSYPDYLSTEGAKLFLFRFAMAVNRVRPFQTVFPDKSDPSLRMEIKRFLIEILFLDLKTVSFIRKRTAVRKLIDYMKTVIENRDGANVPGLPVTVYAIPTLMSVRTKRAA